MFKTKKDGTDSVSNRVEKIKKIPSQVDVGQEDGNREPKTKEDFRLQLMKEMNERRKKLAEAKQDKIDKEA